VPRAGIEPARGQTPADFESAASTSSTTPAGSMTNLKTTTSKSGA
jgi:hypothetical protein